MVEAEHKVIKPETEPAAKVDGPIISIAMDQMPPVNRDLPVNLESVTPHTARTHPETIASLSEAIRQTDSRVKPGQVYDFLREGGIKVKKYDEVSTSKSGKRRRASRFYVLREDLPKITSAIQEYAKNETARKHMKKHPELYTPLFDVISNAGAHITSRRAALLLKGHEIEVAEDNSSRAFVSKKDISRIIHILQSMDTVTQATLDEHPELLSSLGGLIKESGIPTTPDKLAELLPYLDIEVKIDDAGSSKRYIVKAEDRTKIIEFLRGLGKELLA